jgi:hypothetical protein
MATKKPDDKKKPPDDKKGGLPAGFKPFPKKKGG